MVIKEVEAVSLLSTRYANADEQVSVLITLFFREERKSKDP